VKSWTRTLNLDDAHSLLAMAHPGRDLTTWADACHEELPGLSVARRRELVRMLRDGFLDHEHDRIVDGLFLRTYRSAPAAAQIDLVHHQWALTHPLSLVAAERLVASSLATGRLDIPLEVVEEFVAAHLQTDSAESLRKTRTVLLGALEGIGVLETSGTGQHRALRASRGRPHPITFGWLVLLDLEQRGLDGMIASEVPETSLAVRLTQCGPAWARHCLARNVEQGVLVQEGDEVRRRGGVAA
jgi:hypothetical protein